MSAPRFVTSHALVVGDRVRLPPEEMRHVRSRRLADGDAVVLLDGRGGRAEGRLCEGGARVLVESFTTRSSESRRAVTVLLAAAEPSRVEWAIEKGTECGAASFVLVTAERSQLSHVLLLTKRRERLERIAAEAMKQCDRTVVPTIQGPLPLPEALEGAPRPIFLLARDAPALTSPGVEAALSVAVGPEGGFTEAEEILLGNAGAIRASLGPRVLRLETAVVVALARLVNG